MQTQFDHDNNKGRKAEILFEQYLVARNNQTENSSLKGNFSLWDISCTSFTSNVSTFEVKAQSHYHVDNVIIETCRIVDEQKTPSGLSATQADYYVFLFEGDPAFYVIKTTKLKLMVESNKGNKVITYDANGYQLYCYDKAFFKKKCIKLPINVQK